MQQIPIVGINVFQLYDIIQRKRVAQRVFKTS